MLAASPAGLVSGSALRRRMPAAHGVSRCPQQQRLVSRCVRACGRTHQRPSGVCARAQTCMWARPWIAQHLASCPTHAHTWPPPPPPPPHTHTHVGRRAASEGSAAASGAPVKDLDDAVEQFMKRQAELESGGGSWWCGVRRRARWPCCCADVRSRAAAASAHTSHHACITHPPTASAVCCAAC
jgi:hypothetical protein